MTSIHKFACVDTTAILGDDVQVGPFTTIYDNVEIGSGTRIGNNVTIMPGARIGCDVTIFPGAVISAIPQDLKFKGEDTTAIIGDRCVIRECATVNRGTAAKGKTQVGNDCLIMAYSHVAHDCEIGNHVIISNASQLAGEVKVDDFAIIGGGSLIHQFCHIGTHVMLQGGALVNKDIPPYIRAAREPISFNGINIVGLHRRGFDAATIDRIREIYRIVYSESHTSMEAALDAVAEQIPTSPEREIIINFIRKADRGIVRGYNSSIH